MFSDRERFLRGLLELEDGAGDQAVRRPLCRRSAIRQIMGTD